MSKKKLLFVFQNFSSFVSTDYEILSSCYTVKKYCFKPVKGFINTSLALIRQFFFLIFTIWKYEAVYIWFADYFSFLPVLFAKILNKKSFVVIGGYDVNRNRKYKYGALYSKIRGWFTLSTINLCTVNFTVSTYIDRKVKFIAPRSNRVLIHNCISFSGDLLQTPKENIIITVGILDNTRTFYIKGIDTFIEIARQISDFQFVIIGAKHQNISHLLFDLPENLSIYEILPHNELVSFYQKAKFYCQFSRIESFGVAIAESMYFGCIPIVTNIGGMPEIVGDAKYIVPRNKEGIISRIYALSKNDSCINERKERIVDMFSFNSRKEKLEFILQNYI